MKIVPHCQVRDKMYAGQKIDKNHGTDGLLRLFSPICDTFFDMKVSPRYNPRPMSGQHQRLPLEVDPIRLATRKERFQGTIPLKQMKRLVNALSCGDGEVYIDVEFSVDINQVVILAGQIKADAKLICQRCMGEMELPIALDFQLAFVRSEAEMERLPEGYEATLIDNKSMMLSDIIEDEILLALPAIPKHQNEDCSSDNVVGGWGSQQNEPDTESVERDNPFDILASLKTDK